MYRTRPAPEPEPVEHDPVSSVMITGSASDRVFSCSTLAADLLDILVVEPKWIGCRCQRLTLGIYTVEMPILTFEPADSSHFSQWSCTDYSASRV